MTAGEQVVSASELASAIKQIKELQRLLGQKTMENELLKEAVEYDRKKSGLRSRPYYPRMENKFSEPNATSVTSAVIRSSKTKKRL